jgi:hypothetical protein
MLASRRYNGAFRRRSLQQDDSRNNPDENLGLDQTAQHVGVVECHSADHPDLLDETVLRRLQPTAELLAGLEERNVLLADLDLVAGAWVAADVGGALSNRARAETAQFDPRSPRDKAAVINIEERGDNDLGVAQAKMWVGLGDPSDKRHFVQTINFAAQLAARN